MQANRASRTAEAAAATRAYLTHFKADPIFADPYAREFLGRFWKLALATPLRRVVFEYGLKSMRAVAGQVAARSRFTEDKLEAAIAQGTGQYVIVGAGFDTYALRRPELAERLQIYEIDHPDTQAAKIARLPTINGGNPPSNLNFVAVDFEHETIAEGLAKSDFDADAPAFFSWLGTTPYLSNDAAVESLRSIATAAAPGSVVVFDYLGPEADLEDPAEREIYRVLKEFTDKRSEPIIGELQRDFLHAQLTNAGFTIVEELDCAAQFDRYFSNRRDDQCPLPGSYLLQLKL